MSLWTSAEAVSATGGVCAGAWEANGVSIDTRTLQPGDLFVALKAERDGHDFVSKALELGASAALVSHRPKDVADDAPLLIVDDVLVALECMARHARARTRAKVVGVTGSVGKTSTKEMLRIVLSHQGRVHAAEASYNNHWGVPLTLARMPRDVDFAIIEIGMNHPGEIEPLALLARPDIAMITTIAPAHMGAFESLAGIAEEKAAIFAGLKPGGSAVIHGDVDQTALMVGVAKAQDAQILTFGEGLTNTHQVEDIRLVDDTTIATVKIGDHQHLFKLGTAGRHFAVNALGVLAVVDALGCDVTIAARDLMLWRPPAGRGTREIIVLDEVEDDQLLTVIDDAFNANPASMQVALEVLAAAQVQDGVGRVSQGRRIAFLGDMLELGPDEIQMHVDIAQLPALASIDLVHCAGPMMRKLWEALPNEKRGEWTEQSKEMAENVRTIVDAGDVVLVKGSKGSKISLVVDAMRKLGHPLRQQKNEEE